MTVNVHSLNALNTKDAKQKKTVIVTGASGGMGKQVCADLAQSSHNIIMLGRNEAKLLEQAKALRSEHGGFYIPASVDFTKPDSLQHFLNQLSESLEQDVCIDGLVLMMPRIQATTEALPESQMWQNVFSDTFVNPLELVKGLIPYLSRSSRSKVVIISGISSVQVLSHYAINNAMRAAWLAQAKTLAFAYGENNIHFNTISLGGVQTDAYMEKMLSKAQASGRTLEAQMKEEVNNVPLGKYATPEEVSRAINVLLGDFSDHLTGHNIILDGGFTRAY